MIATATTVATHPSSRVPGPPPVAVAFPDRFQGMFARARPRFAPLLVEARTTLAELDVPEVLRPYYDYGVLAHAQPSFVLTPLLFLAVAEDQGGITEQHRRYLPWYLLTMELIGILDDTVDSTPLRSGRTTYWRQFGAASATSFSCWLLSTALEKTAETAPQLTTLVTRMLARITALETWEHHARYPAVDVDALGVWLQRHYDAVPPAVSHALDGALLLHGLPTVDDAVCVRFAELMQDVDDLVNFAERREDDGENDDLKMGIVSHALLVAVRDEPSAAALLERLWAPCRRGAGVDVSAGDYDALAAIVTDVGIPATLDKIAADAVATIAAAPPGLRRCVRDMVVTFVERLRRASGLAAGVDGCLARIAAR